MSKPVVTPGEYSLTELSELFRVSRKTAERYVPRYSIETKAIIRHNKEVTGVVLTEDVIQKILSDNQMSMPGLYRVEPLQRHDDEYGETGKDMLKTSDEPSIEQWLERQDTLFERIDRLQSQLQEAKTEIAALNERVKAKDQIIELLKKDSERQEALLIQATAVNDKVQDFMTVIIDRISPRGQTPETIEYGPIGHITPKVYATQPKDEKSSAATDTINKTPGWMFWKR